MSLENQQEENFQERRAEVSGEAAESVRRAEPVTPVYSIILIVCIAAVWISQIALLPQEEILFGGQISVLTAGFIKEAFAAGEYWRILTGATLHGGLMHLAFNTYALYVLGKLFELLSNRAHLAIVFLLSILGGGALSFLFLPNVASIGASGGVIGFLGYLTAYGFKRRKLLSNAFLKNMLFNIGLIGIVGVFVIPNVDNFAHLGGLLVGLIYGFLQISGDLYADPRETGKFAKIAGFAALGIFILTSALSILLFAGRTL